MESVQFNEFDENLLIVQTKFTDGDILINTIALKIFNISGTAVP